MNKTPIINVGDFNKKPTLDYDFFQNRIFRYEYGSRDYHAKRS